LLSDKIRPIFEAFRREMLALDPCVAEEYLKLYVAYKAETNFADVIPQKNALQLTFNMKWPHLDRFQKKWSPFGGKTASLFSGPPSSESGLNS